MTLHHQLIDLRPAGGFDLIMADPPWSYEMRSEKGYEKSPQAQYATMDMAAIRALPVEALAAPNCLLWLWAVGPMLPEAIDVLAAWGFAFKTTWTYYGYIPKSVPNPVQLAPIGGQDFNANNVTLALRYSF